MKTAILGMMLLLAGLISGVARVFLFNAIKKKYPSQYAKIGSPSVFFQNLDPIVRLNEIRNEIDDADYNRFLKFKRLINLGEGLLFAAFVVFAFWIT